MVRKQRKATAIPEPVETLQSKAPCAVCGLRDARALLDVELAGGTRTVLCGSHELMLRRVGQGARSLEELKVLLADRRKEDRRACGFEEVDELAAALASAFTRERRGNERRAI